MAEPSWIGRTLSGRYEIQELLGQGGMSAVYKANDPNLRRVVAIKMIHSHLSQDPEFVRRFEEEAASVAQLRHPNLIQVYDFNHDGDTYYIVFEFVPGESLQDRLKRTKRANRQMDVAEVTEIAARCADGLQYAHTKGLIHRDIKPANIMINVMGDPIIMDFGIAKIMGGTQHTATGAVLGTARYMSPEQIKGERIDPRTDIYSLGVTLFEMLGGRPPFEADSAMTLMMMHMTDPVPNLRDLRSDVPPGLVAVVNKALAKGRGDRYQTAGDLAAALRSYEDGAKTVPPATVYESSALPAEDMEETVVEPVISDEAADSGIRTGAAMATGATAAAAARTGTPPPVTPSPATADTGATTAPPQGGGGSRTLLYAAGGVLLLIVIAVGIWAAFFRSPGGNGELAGGGDAETPAAVATASATVDTEATVDARVAAQLQTRDASAQQTAEARPTDTAEPEATETEQPEEPTEEPPPGSLAAIGQVEGTVVVLGPGGEEIPLTPDTPIVEGTQIATGEDGRLTFTLEDGSVVQVIGNTLFSLDSIGADPEAALQQTAFTLAEGDLLLRQPEPGNELAVYGPAGNLIGTLLNAATTSAAPKQPVAAKRAAQADGEEAAMSISFEGDVRAVISCFTGICYSGNGSLIRPGWETIVARDDGAFISSFPITSASASYRRWQEACDNCLETAPNPIQPTATTPPTEAPPTWTPTIQATWTVGAPTATPTAIYTATPTPPAAVTATATPTEAAPAYNSRITGIRLDNGTYIVSYETAGFTEQLPGQHVHFYFDTVSEANAGVPGNGPWKLYGGPRPFTQYTEAERGAATSMCIRVANPDHSIIPGSGNCYPLP